MKNMKILKGSKFADRPKATGKKNLRKQDPRNQPYYWLTGKFVNYENGEDTDLWALENNYVSIVPSHHDLTNYKAIKELDHLSFEMP